MSDNTSDTVKLVRMYGDEWAAELIDALSRDKEHLWEALARIEQLAGNQKTGTYNKIWHIAVAVLGK